MRFNEINEAQADAAKVSAVVARLERMGGEMYPDVATNGSEIAKIGVNAGTHFVIYPDGTYDRFEKGTVVTYRAGYSGIPINDPVEAAKRIRRDQEEKERVALQTKRQREYDNEEALRQKRIALISKYSGVQIPEQYRELCEKADEAFQHVLDNVGPDLRSGIGSYSASERETEITKYYDPVVILDLVCDRMYDDTNERVPADQSAIPYGDLTAGEWIEFCKLPIEYQLKVATHWAGSFDL